MGVGIKMDNDFIKSRAKFATALRISYIFLNVYMPFKNHGLNWGTFGTIMLMGVAASLALGVLFSLSHNFEHAVRDPTHVLDEKGSKATAAGDQVCWFKSQVETSCTYGGAISGYFTGGLNFQVEHHLFPRMSSSWYPYIAPKIREVCKKHGVKYAYYPWIHQNFISTVTYMNQTGTGMHWETNPLSGNM
jgi:fatty acid desaturase